MASAARAQRLIDEFENASALAGGGHYIPDGIAAVLRHLAATEADPESWGAVPARTLEELAMALIAPHISLLKRAIKGDTTAAKQLLREAGFTDARGQLLPQYQTTVETPTLLERAKKGDLAAAKQFAQDVLDIANELGPIHEKTAP